MGLRVYRTVLIWSPARQCEDTASQSPKAIPLTSVDKPFILHWQIINYKPYEWCYNQHKRRQQPNPPQCHRSQTILLWHPTRRGGPTNPLIHGTFIEIYVSFIYIYAHFQREAQIHLWTFMASFMIIFDPKKARSAKHLWLIDDHFWLKKQIFNSM